MVFHVLSVPMYPTKKEITLSPFVQKVYKFCKHFTERGHTVYHYGLPESDVPCTKHFDVLSMETHHESYQGLHWKKYLSSDITTKAHNEFNERSAKLIKKNRESKNDIVLAFWGIGNKVACDQLKDFIVVEPSIGYDTMFAENRVFETYTHMHTILGKYNELYPKFTDAVIPPGFELEDFYFNNNKDNYLLFLGRMIDAKGICLAQSLAKYLKMPIKFVGPHNMQNSLDKSCQFSEFIESVSFEERKLLLSNAKALIMPTLYTEACGWVMIEAFLSGTPVISTDWGGMSEYNLHGVTGFRCRSANELYHATINIDKINPQTCYEYAKANFDINHVCDLYENYFKFLLEDKDTVKNTCSFTARPFRFF